MANPAQISIFEKLDGNPTAADGLYRLLKRRFDEADVRVFDLDSAAGALPIPDILVERVAANGFHYFPAMVVDGTVVSVGTLPNLLDAIDLVEQKPPVDFDRVTVTSEGQVVAPKPVLKCECC